MATNPSEKDFPQLDSSVRAWLLDSDPAIRWQVLQDLIGASPDEVAAERARVATEGWGGQLLAQQGQDGSWGGEAWNHGYDSTMHVLTLLWEFGLDPASPQAQQAVGLARDNVIWKGWVLGESGQVDWKGWESGEGNPYFVGEVEPCINGQLAAEGAYFRQDVSGLITRLVGEQMADGGWNCEQENGSVRGSFNTSICVLEALLEYEKAFGPNPEVTQARQRGEEYLLERHLFRRKSTGEPIISDRNGNLDFTTFAFPTWWHYDILRGLEYFRRTGNTPDERVKDAVDVVASRRTPEGRWLLDTSYPGNYPVELGEEAGQPSKWNTLRALRVLKWYSAGK